VRGGKKQLASRAGKNSGAKPNNKNPKRRDFGRIHKNPASGAGDRYPHECGGFLVGRKKKKEGQFRTCEPELNT